MFTKNEIKTFLIKYGSKWFFPDFANKLTWLVVTIGAGLIVVQQPFVHLFINWLINTFNSNSGVEFTLPEIESSADYLAGTILIVIALLYNLAYKYRGFLTDKLKHEKYKEKRQSSRAADIRLFKELRIIFPYETNRFLEEHIWSVKFDPKKIEPLEIFQRHFKNAEYEFNDERIELGI